MSSHGSTESIASVLADEKQKACNAIRRRLIYTPRNVQDMLGRIDRALASTPVVGYGEIVDGKLMSFRHEPHTPANTALYTAPQPAKAGGSAPDVLSEDDVQWIVNDLAELGVMIRGQAFFLYKGGSLVYEDTKHEDGRPMHYRTVGTREFGECCHPINHKDYSLKGTVSLDDCDRWKLLPPALATPSASTPQPEPKPAAVEVTQEWCDLLRRAMPFLRDEAGKYDDDGSNEPLELLRQIEDALTPEVRHGE